VCAPVLEGLAIDGSLWKSKLTMEQPPFSVGKQLIDGIVTDSWIVRKSRTHPKHHLFTRWSRYAHTAATLSPNPLLISSPFILDVQQSGNPGP
jgi:hypothetical protein